MKKKIQEALELAYKDKLGLTDKKVYARVASLGETYVAKDEDIAAFVEKAEDILKGFQGVDDQGRTLQEANAKISELQKQLEDAKSVQGTDKSGNGQETSAEEKSELTRETIAEMLAEAVKVAVKPLSDSLEAMKSQNSAEKALADAKAKFFDGDYAKKYTDEATDAWERTIELNVATGSKMTSEELTSKATTYFNKYVSRKGIDISKPLDSDADIEKAPDFKDDLDILSKEGLLPKEETK